MKQRVAVNREQAREGLGLLVAIVGLMWVVEAVNAADHGALDNHGGIRPRNVDHLWAIITSPFLHQSFFPHLFDNTLPLLFMGGLVALRGAARLAVVTLIVVLVGGIGTWLVSPGNENIIGASGIVFGYATYLFARGIFNRSALELGVGLIVGVVWGGALVASVVPHAGISWQAHVCGAVGGVVAAWLLSASSRASGSGSGPSRTSRGGSGAVERGTRRPGPVPLGGHELDEALNRALTHPR